MNGQDANTLSDVLLDIYLYVKTHYYYYTGVIVGMLDDNKKFDVLMDFIKYNVIGIIMVNVALVILLDNKAPLWAVIVFTNLTGLYFHTSLKHITVEALPKILDLITNSILQIGKAITKRIIDFISKK